MHAYALQMICYMIAKESAFFAYFAPLHSYVQMKAKNAFLYPNSHSHKPKNEAKCINMSLTFS